MLDKAIDALRSYDWGKDYNAIKPIEDAVVSSHGDPAARKALVICSALCRPSSTISRRINFSVSFSILIY